MSSSRPSASAPRTSAPIASCAARAATSATRISRRCFELSVAPGNGVSAGAPTGLSPCPPEPLPDSLQPRLVLDEPPGDTAHRATLVELHERDLVGALAELLRDVGVEADGLPFVRLQLDEAQRRRAVGRDRPTQELARVDRAGRDLPRRQAHPMRQLLGHLDLQLRQSRQVSDDAHFRLEYAVAPRPALATELVVSRALRLVVALSSDDVGGHGHR